MPEPIIFFNALPELLDALIQMIVLREVRRPQKLANASRALNRFVSEVLDIAL
jgi:hypothetical protein